MEAGEPAAIVCHSISKYLMILTPVILQAGEGEGNHLLYLSYLP